MPLRINCELTRVCLCVSHLAAEGPEGGAQLKALLRQNLPRENTGGGVRARDAQKIRAELRPLSLSLATCLSAAASTPPPPPHHLPPPVYLTCFLSLPLALSPNPNKSQLTFSESCLHIIDWPSNPSSRDVRRRPACCGPAWCVRGRSFLCLFFFPPFSAFLNQKAPRSAAWPFIKISATAAKQRGRIWTHVPLPDGKDRASSSAVPPLWAIKAEREREREWKRD